MISGAVTWLSVVPYAIRVYQGKIPTVLTTWVLWSFIGLTMILTYKSSGAENNIWPTIASFLNPLAIVIIVIYRKKGEWRLPTALELICITISIAAIFLWFILRKSQQYSQYALYLSMVADMCAATPTIGGAWKKPEDERPFSWLLFVFGYAIVFFALPDYKLSSILLPAYMCAGCSFIAYPLVRYRVRLRRFSFSDWI